jgi:uncharacterized protein
MKFALVTITAAVVFAAGPALAQSAQPVHTQPGVPAPSAQQQQTPQQPQTLGAPQQPAPAKVDPAKEKAIRQLMDITGESKLGDKMTEAVSFQVKNAMSRRLPADKLDKFMTDFNQKLTAKSPSNEIVDAQIPIYAQHFSMEDLQGMIQFYQSPVGQRMVQTLPEVLQESQRTGAEIERKAALDTLQGMSGDYPELKSMLPQDQQKPSLGPGTPQPQSPKPQSQPQGPQPKP